MTEYEVNLKRLKWCECCNSSFRTPVDNACPNCQSHDWKYVNEEIRQALRMYEEIFYQVVRDNPTATLTWQVDEAIRRIKSK